MITEVRVTVVGSVDHASYSVIALNDIYLIIGEAVVDHIYVTLVCIILITFRIL